MKTNYIKIFLVGLIFSIGVFNLSAQTVDHCGTAENLKRLKTLDPKLEQKISDYEVQIQEWISNHQNLKTSQSPTITIPVVIHVVYKNSSENISTTICNQIITVLNQDFGRTNSDTNQTPAVWKSISANTGVQFCLAQRDPSGAPTTGIERRLTSQPNFTTDDKVKSFAQGGLDSWDVSRYFNIWVCDLTPGLGGYGEFPTGTLSNTFGNVSDYAVVGTGQWVATHECGHCFNLRHIWGDDAGACTGSDLVADTPNQANSSPGTCPTYPALDACTTVSPGIMFMNYMDYGGNGCKNMFTNGQSARINAVVSTAPYVSLATSNGCMPVVLMANDAGNPSIINPSGLVCSTSFTPTVQLRNWGTNTLTSVNINYRIDSNPISTFSWTGSVGTLTIINVTLPSMTTTAGNHTFKCYTTLPNATTDPNNANDTAYSSFNVVPIGQPLPFSYGFEPTAFPPTGWTLYNPDAGVTLARTTGAAKTGAASMWFNSINYTCNGCIDEITLPNLDLTTMSSPLMTFEVAYRLLSDPTQPTAWSDTLRIYVSTDCGTTWNMVYNKFATALTTIIPVYSTTPFVPTAPDWRLETINLAPYASSPNAIIKFRTVSDYENNLYVDDINITSSTGIKLNGLQEAINVFPNPTSGMLTISSSFTKEQSAKVIVTNVLGDKIGEWTLDKATSPTINLDLSGQAEGVYFINVISDSKNISSKIIISRN